MRVYVTRLVVFTTREGENLSSWQALADVLGNEIQGNTETVLAKRMKRSLIYQSL